VQALLSDVHDVPLDFLASAGHTPLDPVQLSARSHSPGAVRQTVAADKKTSTQVFAVPRQWSVPSHVPPCDVPVQPVAADAKTSVGHVALDPVQASAASHWPAAARQTAPALPAGCWQLTLLPSH
jgi:hypothetical protein